MKRLLFSLGMTATLAAGTLGCRSESPQETPPASDQQTEQPQSPESASDQPTAPQTADAPQTKLPQPAEPPKSEDLRALAARLIEPDGEGWRLNDAAALELEKRGPEAAQQFWDLLADPSAEVRRSAAFVLLERFRPENPQHVEAFSRALEDDDSFVRGRALQAFQQMNHADVVAAIPRLAKLLDAQHEPDPVRRTQTARLLQRLKDEAADATDELQTAAGQDPSAQVRATSLVAVSQIAPAEQVVPAVQAALADPEASVRLVAAARLRERGPAAAPAAAELAKALSDADERVRNAAAEALVRIGQPAVEPLVPVLDAKEPHARQLALACLIKLAPHSKEALPAIKKRLEDDDETVRKLAEIAVKQLEM